MAPGSDELAAEIHEPLGRYLWILAMCFRPLLIECSGAVPDQGQIRQSAGTRDCMRDRALTLAVEYLKLTQEELCRHRAGEPFEGELAHDPVW